MLCVISYVDGATSGLQKLAGPMFNIYLVGPSQDPNPDNWVTEVNFSIAS